MGKTIKRSRIFRTSKKSRKPFKKILGGSAHENSEDRYLEIQYLDTHGIVRTMIAKILYLGKKGELNSNQIDIEHLLIYMTTDTKNNTHKIFIKYYDLSQPKTNENLLNDTLIGVNGISNEKEVNIDFTTFIIKCKYMSKKEEQQKKEREASEKERLRVEKEREDAKIAEKEKEAAKTAEKERLRVKPVQTIHSTFGQANGQLRD